ncbi:MAG TPA: LmeA family phospholipid-binding protein [Streptosporangiaceae bacterium]|nr:LmeA family phospholipid-binding protein [Streptosporangiaceae bacterium]
MADRWPFDEWKRNLAEVVSVSSAAAASLGLPQPGLLLGDPFTRIVDAARNWLIGKKRTFSVAGQDLTLVLEDLSVEGSDLARAVGQYGQLRILARDVEWDDYRLERLEVEARNVHLRPGTKPVLVSAPIRGEAFLSAAAASRWLAAASPRLELAMHAGVPQVGLVGAPWLRLEVEAGAEGKSIRVVPRALHLLDQRLALRVPAFHVPLPELPFDIMLTSVEPAPGGFVLRGVQPEWQRPLARADLERLLATIRGSNA